MSLRTSLIFSLLIIIIAIILGYYFASSMMQPEVPELKILLGQEKCHRCGMIISDIRYAAAIYVGGEVNEWWKYDDVGEMALDYYEKRNSYEFLAVRVHDFLTGEEVDGYKAWYVVADPKKLWTPMGYGVIAFKDKMDAEREAKEHNGVIMNWEKLLETVPNINPVMSKP